MTSPRCNRGSRAIASLYLKASRIPCTGGTPIRDDYFQVWRTVELGQRYGAEMPTGVTSTKGSNL